MKTCLVKNFWKRFEEMFSKMSENVKTPIYVFSVFSIFVGNIFGWKRGGILVNMKKYALLCLMTCVRNYCMLNPSNFFKMHHAQFNRKMFQTECCRIWTQFEPLKLKNITIVPQWISRLLVHYLNAFMLFFF